MEEEDEGDQLKYSFEETVLHTPEITRTQDLENLTERFCDFVVVPFDDGKKRIITCSLDRTLRVFNENGEFEEVEEYTAPFQCLHFIESSSLLLTSTKEADREIVVWRVNKSKGGKRKKLDLMAEITLQKPADSNIVILNNLVSVTPLSFLACCVDATSKSNLVHLKFSQLNRRKVKLESFAVVPLPVDIKEMESEVVESIYQLRTQNNVILFSGGRKKDYSIKKFVNDKEETQVFARGHTDCVRCITSFISTESSTEIVVSGSADGGICFWTIEGKMIKQMLLKSSISCLLSDRNNKTLLVGLQYHNPSSGEILYYDLIKETFMGRNKIQGEGILFMKWINEERNCVVSLSDDNKVSIHEIENNEILQKKLKVVDEKEQKISRLEKELKTERKSFQTLKSSITSAINKVEQKSQKILLEKKEQQVREVLTQSEVISELKKSLAKEKEENERLILENESIQLEKRDLESQLEKQNEVIEKLKQTGKLFDRVPQNAIENIYQDRSEMGFLRLSLKPGELKIDKKEDLGSGAFGNVFGGTLHIEREVAIKEVRFRLPRARNVQRPLREQVLNEYKVQSSFIKKEVLRVFGMTEPFDEYVVRYIMEKMDGDIATLVQREEMKLNEKFLLLQEMAICVHKLHRDAPPIVHRDIKAANFLYRKKGNELEVKICDFGLVRGLHAGKTSINTNAAGTKGWMAPETKNGSFSVYSDIFALGVAFWEVLFERLPFTSDQQNYQLFVNPGSILPDLETPEGLPEEFSDLLKWMWKDRPPRQSEVNEEEGEWDKEDYRPDINQIVNWFKDIMSESSFLEKLSQRFPS